jgi:hypothetical protein
VRKAVVALSMTLLAFFAGARPLSAHSVPIVIHGNSEELACASTGVVKLDPNGDGFLAVRAGPSTNFFMTDKILNGQEVWLCEETGSWLGVVYPPNNHKIVDTGESCNVNNLWRKTSPYTGPCKFGWVFKQYIVGQSG